MKREFVPPTPDMMDKIRQAEAAVAGHGCRSMKCPYCHHRSIIVFDDARGHIQSKCKVCGRETVFDLVNMRRIPLSIQSYLN